jgi:Fe-Mn family superoxide dismutase
MDRPHFYSLPKLSYGFKDLEPHISLEQLQIHYEKHHRAYVTGANAILEKLDQARREKTDLDMKATLKELSFHIGGHVLHTLFWGNLAPPGKSVAKPEKILATALDKEFGSFDQFRKEFTQAAVAVEGSGWAVLSFCRLTNRPVIMQIEKHNVNVYPMFTILMVLDLWEHAYYLDYKNLRAKFVEAFWSIVNWDEVRRRFEMLLR